MEDLLVPWERVYEAVKLFNQLLKDLEENASQGYSTADAGDYSKIQSKLQGIFPDIL